MGRLLITGSEGYIGTRLLKYLAGRGFDVSGLDTGFFAADRFYDDEFCPSIRQDTREISPADLTGFDAIVHLADLSNDPLAELDPDLTRDINHRGTLGPLLKRKAGEAGVVYTNSDGDQPGVILNLYRFVTGIGLRPVLCGNIKGLHDPYRNPTTRKPSRAAGGRMRAWSPPSPTGRRSVSKWPSWPTRREWKSDSGECSVRWSPRARRSKKPPGNFRRTGCSPGRDGWTTWSEPLPVPVYSFWQPPKTRCRATS